MSFLISLECLQSEQRFLDHFGALQSGKMRGWERGLFSTQNGCHFKMKNAKKENTTKKKIEFQMFRKRIRNVLAYTGPLLSDT